MSTPDQPTDLNQLRAADGPRDPAGPKHDGQYMPLEPAVPQYGQYVPQDGGYVPVEPVVPQYGQFVPQDTVVPQDGGYVPVEPAVPQYGQYVPQAPAVPQDPAAAPYAQYGVPQPGALPYPQPADGYAASPVGGTSPAYPAHPYNTPVYRGYSQNKLAVWSLVLGILGIGLCGALAGSAALITGLYARKAVERGEADNGGVAIAGIVLGAVAILWWFFAVVVA